MTETRKTSYDVDTRGADLGMFQIVAPRTAGEDVDSEVIFPTLADDGTIVTHDYDGTAIERFPVDFVAVTETVFAGETIEEFLSNKPRIVWQSIQIELMVTDARVAFRTLRPQSGGEVYVGHVRHSWLQSVGSRPRQGWLYPCAVNVVVPGGLDSNSNYTWIELEFHLARSVDSARIAQHIAQRAARHCLQEPDLPESLRPRYAELVDSERQPDPAKGEMAEFTMPGNREQPGAATWALTV